MTVLLTHTLLKHSKTQIEKKIISLARLQSTLSTSHYKYVIVEPLENVPVPKLKYNLDKVFAESGPHFLQNPETKSFDFSSVLQDISCMKNYDPTPLSPFIPPSMDTQLQTIAQKQSDVRFMGSTSSLTGPLSLLQYLIMDLWEIDMSLFSSEFKKCPRTFTERSRESVHFLLKYHPWGQYSIDTWRDEKEDEGTGSILMKLGHSLEKFLISSDVEFKSFLHACQDLSKAHLMEENRSYHYAKAEGFLMRSQLDCHDPRLPLQSFDLKSRANIAVRMSSQNREAKEYPIKTVLGLYESFERELYDLLRSGLLKYGLQARIGNMDGIFLTFHNIEQIFGFQYMTLHDIETIIYKSSKRAEDAFALGLRLFNHVLTHIISIYSKGDVKITFGKVSENGIKIYAAPVESTESEEALCLTLKIVSPYHSTVESDPCSFSFEMTSSQGHKEWLRLQKMKRGRADGQPNDYFFKQWKDYIHRSHPDRTMQQY